MQEVETLLRRAGLGPPSQAMTIIVITGYASRSRAARAPIRHIPFHSIPTASTIGLLKALAASSVWLFDRKVPRKEIKDWNHSWK